MPRSVHAGMCKQLEAVQIGDLRIPVVRVPHHHPLLGDLALLEHEGAGAGRDHLAEVLVVLVQGLLGVDDHRRGREELEEVRLRLLEDEPHVEAVDRLDLGHRRELVLVDAGHARRREDDARERGHHVGRAERGAVVELHAVAQLERVRLAVRRHLPALREIRDDRLEAVGGIEAHEVVVHLAQDDAERALVHVEVRHLRGPRPLEHAPALGVRLGGARLVGRRGLGRRRVLQRPRGQRGAGGRPRGCLEKPPAIHLAAETGLVHVASLLWDGARLPYAGGGVVVNRCGRVTLGRSSARTDESSGGSVQPMRLSLVP